MEEQIILRAGKSYEELDEYLKENGAKHVFLVCGNSISYLTINSYFENLESRTGIAVTRFCNFKPNPLYESVVEGVELFREQECDMIIAVGGGSAIDVAKCIKLYSNMNQKYNYLKQKIVPNEIKLLAIPTTAGSGSEATRYAVIYFEGKKQSVSDDSCIPSAVLLDASVLKKLPEYQRKSTMLDALCHAIESFWSVNSTEKSKEFSRRAIRTILENRAAYLKNDDRGNGAMLEAANLAGKAINITQTTAGHAMCYQLTSLYGIAHGHAVALCLSKLWPYMVENLDQCIDPRGSGYLKKIFLDIADAMGCKTIEKSIMRFQDLLEELELFVPNPKEEDYCILKSSVNPVRLKNNPIALDVDTIDRLYHQILA